MKAYGLEYMGSKPCHREFLRDRLIIRHEVDFQGLKLFNSSSRAESVSFREILRRMLPWSLLDCQLRFLGLSFKMDGITNFGLRFLPCISPQYYITRNMFVHLQDPYLFRRSMHTKLWFYRGGRGGIGIYR